MIKKSRDKNRPPLSIDEIINIRNISTEGEYYKNLYVFEMFLTNGLTLDEIVECTSDVYYPEENAFKLDSKKEPIYLSLILSKLINDHQDLLFKRKRYWFENKNKETGILINRENGLILKDIYKAREKFFPSCPKCEKRYPSIDEFWVLVEFENDNYKSKWLYCRNCVNNLDKKKK